MALGDELSEDCRGPQERICLVGMQRTSPHAEYDIDNWRSRKSSTPRLSSGYLCLPDGILLAKGPASGSIPLAAQRARNW